MIDVTGHQATMTVQVSGAPALLQGAPYAHAQHVHIGGQGVCAPPTADANGDGAVDSMEGQPFTGAIAASLTTAGDVSPASGAAADRYPAGSAYTYQRTVTLDDATLAALKAGTAVINIHGVDPATLSAAAQAAVNPMNTALPLATDIPIACGVFAASQVTGGMPNGAPDTGVAPAAANESTASTTVTGATGLAVLAAGALTWLGVRRSRSRTR